MYYMINGGDLKGDTFPSMRGGDAIGLETTGILFHYLGTHIGFTKYLYIYCSDPCNSQQCIAELSHLRMLCTGSFD